VVDPITLLAMLAGIAAISLILRQAVINKIMGRKKRSLQIDNWQAFLIQGKRVSLLSDFSSLPLKFSIDKPGNAKGGSITVPLTSYLTGLD